MPPLDLTHCLQSGVRGGGGGPSRLKANTLDSEGLRRVLFILWSKQKSKLFQETGSMLLSTSVQ